MSEREEFLTWISEQDYYIERGVVEEKFPNLEFEMVGITVTFDEETGETLVPKRDYRRGLKY